MLYDLGRLQLDSNSREVWMDDETVTLSKHEYGLLALLLTDPTRVFTKSEILRIEWGWQYPAAHGTSERTLDSHASRLRQKLRRADGPKFVQNVWGVGYRLIDTLALREQRPDLLNPTDANSLVVSLWESDNQPPMLLKGALS